MLLLVLSRRCFSQILIIIHTNRDMSRFARICIFNDALRLTRGRLTLRVKPLLQLMTDNHIFVGSMEAPSKAFLLFFLLPGWRKLNHLKSRMECGFLDIFSRHICSTVAETIGVTNNAACFGAKKCSENHI